jgi:DNA-binding CsgD family transcriptional regulator
MGLASICGAPPSAAAASPPCIPDQSAVSPHALEPAAIALAERAWNHREERLYPGASGEGRFAGENDRAMGGVVASNTVVNLPRRGSRGALLGSAVILERMSRLGAHERAVFDAVRGDCARELDSAALRASVAERLARCLGADAYCAMELDPASALPVHHVNRGWPEDYVEPLVEHALWVSPIGDTATLLRHPRRAVVADELLAGGSVRDDPYFQFHILPYGYRYELLLHCRSAGAPRALFTFNRKEARGDFEPRHVRLLDALAPHLGAAVHAACVRESLRAPSSSSTGFVVLDEAGQIAHAGGAGVRLLSDGEVLGVRIFLGLVRRALRDPSHPLPAPLVLSDRSTGAPYRLVAERCASANRAPHAAILVEPARPDDPSGLRRLGLTAREAEVTLALLRCDDVRVLARRLACSPATIAQHRKSVFAKLSVSSRRELAVRLLGHGWKSDGYSP